MEDRGVPDNVKFESIADVFKIFIDEAMASYILSCTNLHAHEIKTTSSRFHCYLNLHVVKEFLEERLLRHQYFLSRVLKTVVAGWTSAPAYLSSKFGCEGLKPKGKFQPSRVESIRIHAGSEAFRLKPSTMEKLVYIHANARLLNKITAVDYEETNVECKTEANEASGSDSCETDLGSENEID